MAFLGAWAEHVWTRMRRLDYWNTEHAISNTPAKLYRRVSPGSQPAALVQRKEASSVYSIRYYNKDLKRRDTGYYPDTPLTLNHTIMQGQPVRPSDAPASQVPKVGAFGSATYAGPEIMGIKTPNAS